MSNLSFYTAIAVSQKNALNAAMGFGSTIYGILYFLFMSAVILGAAYFATKYLARRGLNRSGNKNLKIIESVSLGIDRSLLLVKVGEQYLLLGSTQKNITMLSEIDSEKLSTTTFKDVYSKIESVNTENYMDTMHNEAQGVNTIKHSLNRLKSIVRGNKTDV